MIEQVTKTMFKPQSWSDVGVLVSLLALLLGVIQWGLKLDDRQSDHNKRLGKVEQSVEMGILPIADERYKSMNRRISKLEQDISRHDESNHPRATQ